MDSFCRFFHQTLLTKNIFLIIKKNDHFSLQHGMFRILTVLTKINIFCELFCCDIEGKTTLFFSKLMFILIPSNLTIIHFNHQI
jgi:hypothetical protein